jgi:hypothetical protein
VPPLPASVVAPDTALPSPPPIGIAPLVIEPLVFAQPEPGVGL